MPVCFAALFFLISLAIAQDSPPTETEPAGASLDLLVSRVNSYWKLLQGGKRMEAEEFITPSDRERFRNATIPPFSDPRLKSLEFSVARTRVFVTINVKRMLLGAMDWPVVDQWIFENDNWYRAVPKGASPMFATQKKTRTPLSAEEIEAEKNQLREMIQFEKSVLDFGTVQQESRIFLTLKYSLKSDAPLRTKINSPQGIKIQGLKDQYLVPGQNRELTILVPAQDYDGSVAEKIVLTVRHHEVEVPFEITLKGFVKAEISALPRILRFNDSKGETEKEILIRNHTKSPLVLKSLFSDSDVITVEPLPVTIKAGKQMTMKVRQVRSLAQANASLNLEIVFAKPVANISSLKLTAIINAKDEKPAAPNAPAITPEIQDLIRKNQFPLPKR